jgi:hypothetical protein
LKEERRGKKAKGESFGDWRETVRVELCDEARRGKRVEGGMKEERRGEVKGREGKRREGRKSSRRKRSLTDCISSRKIVFSVKGSEKRG